MNPIKEIRDELMRVEYRMLRELLIKHNWVQKSIADECDTNHTALMRVIRRHPELRDELIRKKTRCGRKSKEEMERRAKDDEDFRREYWERSRGGGSVAEDMDSLLKKWGFRGRAK